MALVAAIAYTDYTDLKETPEYKAKMHSDVRYIEAKPIEGKFTKSSGGLIDTRIFTGENKIIAERDPMTSFWTVRYEQGALPQAFRGSWTSFTRLMDYLKSYFEKRNIEVKEIIDGTKSDRTSTE